MTYKDLIYFKGMAKEGFKVTGNLVNCRDTAYICSGFYLNIDIDGNSIVEMAHPHEVFIDSIKAISYEEYAGE